MVVYVCERCLCKYNKKSQYDCHINRKYKCKTQSPDIINKSFVCNDPNTEILTNILEELKNVKTKLANVENDNKKTNKKLQKLEEVNKLLKQTNMINNGPVINNKHINNGTINTTINVVAFGKENMDFSIDEIGKLCQGNKTVPNLINYMHFNESKPENHNVYMPNRKNKSEVFVHNGVKWMLADKKATVEQLIDKGIEYVEGKMEELSTVISKSKYNAVERAIDAYNENEGDANNEANKKITKDIELILYNNKDLIMTPKIKWKNHILHRF